MKASTPLLLTAAVLVSTGTQAGIYRDMDFGHRHAPARSHYFGGFSMPSFMHSMSRHRKVTPFNGYTDEMSISKSWSMTKTTAWGGEDLSFGTVDYTLAIDFTSTWTTHRPSTTYLSDTDISFGHFGSPFDWTDESDHAPSEGTVVSHTVTKTITTQTTFDLPTDHHFPPIFNYGPFGGLGVGSIDVDIDVDIDITIHEECLPTDSVPEPTSLALLGSGALVMLRRRRRQG